MKLLISFLLFLLFTDNSYANNTENKRTSCVGDLLKIYPKYIYQYPKNIDKMIEENPEFKDEILSDPIFLDADDPYRRDNENLIMSVSKAIELNCMCDHFKCNKLKSLNAIMNFFATECEMSPNIGTQQFRVYIYSCKELWLYADKIKYINSLDRLILLCNLQNECNKIIKKILKKTGKLY